MKPESKVGESPKGKKKAKGPKKKAKKDPNEPQKPISAYALFFRDTQAVIKRQNPNATFGEVSKIVASMWDSLDPDAKNVYKEKTDAAKKEYAKALAAYRASLTEKEESNHCEDIAEDVEPANPVAEHSSPAASPPQVQVLESPAHSKPSPPVVTLDEMAQPADETPAELPEATLTEQKSPQPVIDISASSEEQDANGENEPNISNGIITAEVQICLRSGCTNPVVDSPEWDQEYCSSKCVVEHCSAVFMAHVAARQKNIIEIS